MATKRYAEPDETAREILASLPSSFRDLFHFLQMEVIRAHLTWRTWRDLFSHSQDRNNLLDRTAGCFFADLMWVLRDDVLLRIARLNDPAHVRVRQEERENASLWLLLERTKSECPTELHEGLSRDLEAFKAAVAGVIAIRNRELGHPDFAIVVGHEAPKEVTVDEVTSLLDQAASFMNRVSLHFSDSVELYGNVVQKGDVEDLVQCLGRASNAADAPCLPI